MRGGLAPVHPAEILAGEYGPARNLHKSPVARSPRSAKPHQRARESARYFATTRQFWLNALLLYQLEVS